MKIEELLESAISSSTVYYHGTTEKFDTIENYAKKYNNGLGNISGVWFTPFESEAKNFGNRIIRVNLKVRKPFYSGVKNKINKKMLDTAERLLKKYTKHSDSWIENALLPEMKKTGSIRAFVGLDGDIQRDLLLSGGYDVYIDGYQLANEHVLLLNPNKKNHVML